MVSLGGATNHSSVVSANTTEGPCVPFCPNARRLESFGRAEIGAPSSFLFGTFVGGRIEASVMAGEQERTKPQSHKRTFFAIRNTVSGAWRGEEDIHASTWRPSQSTACSPNV